MFFLPCKAKQPKVWILVTAPQTRCLCAIAHPFPDSISGHKVYRHGQTEYFRKREMSTRQSQFWSAMLQLFTDFKKAHNSVRRQVIYNTVFGFGIHIKVLGLIKLCLNKPYKSLKRKTFSHNFLINEMICLRCFQTLL